MTKNSGQTRNQKKNDSQNKNIQVENEKQNFLAPPFLYKIKWLLLTLPIFNILDAPSILTINGKLDYNENENGSIQCNVDGQPTPELKWLFVEGLQTTLLSTRHDLVFINTKCLEMGLYRCIAKNIKGDDVSEVTIIVKCRYNYIVIVICIFIY